MKRIKKHKNSARPGTSRSTHRTNRPPDLAYFINDRVELLHQAFTILKTKEIRAMAPDSVRNLPVDNIQELCLEELLGISSKRLCAILDGSAPPSDTDSSSNSDRQDACDLDNVSLESISSDEAALNPDTKLKEKKRKRCKRRRESKKLKGRKTSDNPEAQSRTADRAGLTVLELLELQARARAIRAQLEADGKKNEPTATVTGEQVSGLSDDDDVQIKEEPPVVVELSSSGDEKPDLNELQKITKEPKPEPEPRSPPNIQESTQTITKRNDLTIIVPKPPTAKKIKLNRRNPIISATTKTLKQTENCVTPTTSLKSVEFNDPKKSQKNENTIVHNIKVAEKTHQVKQKKKNKHKKKKRKQRKEVDVECSDHDEISLQLSDSEKMDLLEDFDQRTSTDESTTSSEESIGESEVNNLNNKMENPSPDQIKQRGLELDNENNKPSNSDNNLTIEKSDQLADWSPSKSDLLKI